MSELVTYLLLFLISKLGVELCGFLLVFLWEVFLLWFEWLVRHEEHRRLNNQLILQCLLQFIKLLVQTRVPLVFDLVIGTALQIFGNFRPLVAVDLMSEQKCPFFFYAPFWPWLDQRVQIIMPSFSTLLAAAAAQLLSYLSPVLCSTFLN